MTNNQIMKAAAARLSTLSTPASPIMLPTLADAWRTRVPVTAVEMGIGGTSVFGTPRPNHNSIAPKLAVPVNAYRGVNAAKQAAPPRGVPR
jgi:hypothetical protein